MNELSPVTYICAYCGEENEAMVDPTGGAQQQYVEDCTVCCRPNLLSLRISPEGEITLTAEYDE